MVIREGNQERIERRTFSAAMEVRAAEDGQEHIVGYAAVFNSLSDELWGFRERIAPGFFADVLGDDVRGLINHDSNYVLGRTMSGTLALTVDGQGLSVDIVPPEAQWARDYLVSIKRGDIDQMSFSFEVSEDRWDDVNDEVIRTLIKCKRLWDVSVVTYPAYPQTSAQVREQAAELRAQLAAGNNGGGGPRARLALRKKKLRVLEQEMI